MLFIMLIKLCFVKNSPPPPDAERETAFPVFIKRRFVHTETAWTVCVKRRGLQSLRGGAECRRVIVRQRFEAFGAVDEEFQFLPAAFDRLVERIYVVLSAEPFPLFAFFGRPHSARRKFSAWNVRQPLASRS